MREFKFRAWSKETNEMITDFSYSYELAFVDGQFNLYRQGAIEWVVDSVIMQAIGKEDKNGNTIFEGDIVEYEGEKYEIVYDKDTASYVLKEGKEKGWILGGKGWKKVKVVGNVYENPELLEQEG